MKAVDIDQRGGTLAVRDIPVPEPRQEGVLIMNQTAGFASNYDLALGYLRRADPVLARLIDAHPGFDPRAWGTQLPPLDAFGALLFQVMGQQLSVPSTRAILRRVQALFEGRLPTPAEFLAASRSEE